MSFRHKFPSSVVGIGYIENAVFNGRTKSSGIRVRARLYNPSDKYHKYDLRVPLIALGTPGKLLIDKCKTGELVTVIGRLVMVQSDDNLNLEVLVEHIKSLDEDEIHGMDESNV